MLSSQLSMTLLKICADLGLAIVDTIDLSINGLRNVVGVALREYVFWGVAGPPFLQLSSILPMDCIQMLFALCVAAGFMFE